MPAGPIRIAHEQQHPQRGLEHAALPDAAVVAVVRGEDSDPFRIERLGPIVTVDDLDDPRPNCNGPALLLVPEWIERPLGCWHCHFALHKDPAIRLTYADDPAGPRRLHEHPVLHIADTPFDATAKGAHIASPDIRVDEEQRRIRMYVYGYPLRIPAPHRLPLPQATVLATSVDGVRFESRDELIAGGYLRTWTWQGVEYGVSWSGWLWRSPVGIASFQQREPGLGPDCCAGQLQRSTAGVTLPATLRPPP